MSLKAEIPNSNNIYPRLNSISSICKTNSTKQIKSSFNVTIRLIQSKMSSRFTETTKLMLLLAKLTSILRASPAAKNHYDNDKLQLFRLYHSNLVLFLSLPCFITTSVFAFKSYIFLLKDRFKSVRNFSLNLSSPILVFIIRLADTCEFLFSKN